MEERGISRSAQDIQITIVEDDVDLQDLIRAFFQPRGYSLSFFNSATDLIAETKRKNLTADVIITDLNLPEMKGTDLIAQLREWGVTLPVILITAKSSVQVACDATQAGAFDFIVKPLNLQQLEISVQRAIRFKEILHENVVLRQTLKQKTDSFHDQIIAKSAGFRAALDLAKRVSNSTANVLITGESGTGKEVVARATHDLGERKQAPFVAINCAAIPETLLEAELFGYAKGSFTGAIEKKEGLFEEAQGGTLFLDEIGDLSLPLQAKILRVLQERKIKRIGENKSRDIDVRVVTATHKDLKKEIQAKKFREDLFFRLNVIPIRIPPLRERDEDILPLAEFFLRRFAVLNGVAYKKFSKDALSFLLRHSWPGNVRELENLIERAVVLSNQPEISMQDLVVDSSSPQAASAQVAESETGGMMSQAFNLDQMSMGALQVTPGLPVEEVLKKHILNTLQFNGGSREKTARMLQIDRKTLYRKLLQYGSPMAH
ncbi:MAG: sigma-54-dependent transcriptional regulator [Pseudobdellovibrionaceae bacterium]